MINQVKLLLICNKSTNNNCIYQTLIKDWTGQSNNYQQFCTQQSILCVSLYFLQLLHPRHITNYRVRLQVLPNKNILRVYLTNLIVNQWVGSLTVCWPRIPKKRLLPGEPLRPADLDPPQAALRPMLTVVLRSMLAAVLSFCLRRTPFKSTLLLRTLGLSKSQPTTELNSLCRSAINQ